jgi:hypothetical protein
MHTRSPGSPARLTNKGKENRVVEAVTNRVCALMVFCMAKQTSGYRHNRSNLAGFVAVYLTVC